MLRAFELRLEMTLCLQVRNVGWGGGSQIQEPRGVPSCEVYTSLWQNVQNEGNKVSERSGWEGMRLLLLGKENLVSPSLLF